jgi:hypothetical protein
MHHGEHDPAARRQAGAAGRQHRREVGDVVQREPRDDDVEAARRGAEVLDGRVLHVAGRASQRLARGRDYAARAVDAQEAARSRVE